MRVPRGVLALIAAAIPTIAYAKTDAWTRFATADERVTAMAVAPANPGTVYIGTVSGSIFKIVDGEQTRLPDHVGSGLAAVTAIAVDPRNSAVLLAATSDGIFKSVDGGIHWSATGLRVGDCIALAIDGVDANIVYAGTALSGLHKSTDAGGTWSRILSSESVRAIAIDPQNHQIVYVGTSLGIARSMDAGASWATQAWPNGPVGGFAIDPVTPSTVYVGSTTGGVFKSTDRGATWLNSGLNTVGVHALVVDIQEADTVYAATDQGPFKSIDAGRTWYRIGEGLPFAPTLVMSGDLELCRVYIATNDGVFRTDIGPVLTLHADLCIGRPWKVVISHAPGNSTVRLLGISNGVAWEIPDWGLTNGAGMLTMTGTFPTFAVGTHGLGVEIAGSLSNVISFTVENCRRE